MNRPEYCSVCRHGVYDMKIHIRTEEHKRRLRNPIGVRLKKPSRRSLGSGKMKYGYRFGKEE